MPTSPLLPRHASPPGLDMPRCKPCARNIPNWSGRRDLNPRPLGPEPSALPGCATPRATSVSADVPQLINLHELNGMSTGLFFNEPKDYARRGHRASAPSGTIVRASGEVCSKSLRTLICETGGGMQNQWSNSRTSMPLLHRSTSMQPT